MFFTMPHFSSSKYFYFLSLLGVPLLGVCQSANTSFIPNITPPSPTAAALEKYGQVPVSTYTGVPNISLPLYEVKVRDLSIPISLNYHAGGFRVNDEASWVGLGWSLIAGGAITRTVRNLDDLQYFIRPGAGFPFIMPDHTPGTMGTNDGNGFNEGDGYVGMRADIHSSQYLWVNGSLFTAGNNNSTDPLIDQNSDWEPDDFRFTMGSYSGHFAFKQDGTIHMLEQQKIKIEPPLLAQPQSGWKITTPDGAQYFFAAQEKAGMLTPALPRQQVTTAWYLNKVVSPLGEEATLEYDTGDRTYNQLAFMEKDYVERYGPSCTTVAPSTYVNSSSSGGWNVPQYLKRITFKTGYVLFERETTTSRSDLQGGQRLKQIKVYNSAGELIKAYDLQASYFLADATIGHNLPANDPGIPYVDKRLRLDAVIESGNDGLAKPATSFQYNTTMLPPKTEVVG